MADVAAGTGPSSLKEETPAPSRRSIGYRIEARLYEADLYEPGPGAVPGGALVLVPGVSPHGRDDARLVAFANSMARARFVVLVPELAGLRQLRVSPSDTVAIADAVRQLAAMTQAGEGEAALGLVAFSYAAGPGLLAALEPDVGPTLGFLLLVGGYHGVEALATFVTTGHFRTSPHEPWRQRAPNPRGKWVFLLSNVDRVDDGRDRATLREIGERKFDDPEADIGALSAALGEEGRAIERYLNNVDPERVPALIEGLPAGIRADMAALDPSARDLSALRPRLYLVHGEDDAVIPYTESEALARAAPNAIFFKVDRLAHVDLGPAGWLDALTLWRAAYLLLGERSDAALGVRE
ncbi:MAG: alpha/beta hydrolase [Alphaproteobacteria bacterium]